MSISTTAVWAPTRDQAITSAMWELGVLHAGQTIRQEHLEVGAEFLSEILQSLTNRGVALHVVEWYTQTLTVSQAAYTAPADTVSIEVGAYISNVSTGLDQVLVMKPYDQYASLTTKALDGVPTECYPLHTSTAVTLYLYPRPITDWTTLVYPRTRRPRDNDTGAVSLDVPARYNRAVKLQLAAAFARHFKQPVTRVGEIQERADDELAAALSTDTTHGDLIFVAPMLGDY